MKHLFAFLLAAFPTIGATAPWTFSAPVDASNVNGPGVFHHLGSGGRLGVSVSSETVAIAWEDNRDGVPRCYVALLVPATGKPIIEHQVSGDGAAFEPAIQGIGDGRFAVAWEEDGGIWARMLDAERQGPALRVDGAPGAHASLAWHPRDGLFAAWSRAEGDRRGIWLATLDTVDDKGVALRVLRRIAVDTESSKGDQSYSSVMLPGDGSTVVAWEDRRHGHTVIMAAHQDASVRFTQPMKINESLWGGRELGLGRGTGAMRVTLAGRGDDVLAIWADKRDFRSGYDVYGAFSSDGGRTFGDNEKIQDEFADGVAQWHPVAATGSTGQTAVAWDDDRDGSSDIWISWRESGEWSADLDVPGASGAGHQVEPAIAIDDGGNLHLSWVDKADAKGFTRVRYLYAPLERQ